MPRTTGSRAFTTAFRFVNFAQLHPADFPGTAFDFFYADFALCVGGSYD
jgi:hypothetical protein